MKNKTVSKGNKTFVLAFLLALLVWSGSHELISGKGILEVHFIDVGQADCMLVKTPGGHTMLIDAGNRDDVYRIISYLNSQKVRNFDVVVGTHPHEDHIGSLDRIIRQYNIGRVYLPKVEANTKTFRDLLLAIQAKNLKITTAAAGVLIPLDPEVRLELLAPNVLRYENINDYSIVMKLTYGKTTFLFAGDATRESERQILKIRYNLKADLLKVGHHGSNTSTTGNFLKAVAPRLAVISVGAGNDYGYPGKYTVQRLIDSGATIYRTDLNGTIVASSDGKRIQLQTRN